MDHPPLAFVMLDNPTTPNISALARTLRGRHPELPVEAVADNSPAASSPLLRCGDALVAVMSLPAPMPRDPSLWSRTAAAWPEGNTIAARHRGHLLVAALGKDQKPLAAARLTTAVVGALIATIPECCGVVWGGKLARPSKLWLEMSERSFAPFPDCPFMSWVDILPFRSDAGIGAVTMGLTAFAGREIEFETAKLPYSAMIDEVAGLAAFLVEHGGVVKDGDTFGRDEHERFTVRYKNSDRFGSMPVFFCAGDS